VNNTLVVRHLGVQPYLTCWQQMKQYTDQRDSDAVDELWLVQHPPVFTLGQAGKEEHILDAGDIEVVRSDRGGQVTYHGPGQLVGYLLMDIKRRGLGIRRLVTDIEDLLVDVLVELGITATSDSAAHGVYVSGSKIAALGLRVRKGCTYHGFSLNVDVNLSPFSRINPCGYPGLAVVDISGLVGSVTMADVESLVIKQFADKFGYDALQCSESHRHA
jgi:lipoyl(octanoyl) transferase